MCLLKFNKSQYTDSILLYFIYYYSSIVLSVWYSPETLTDLCELGDLFFKNCNTKKEQKSSEQMHQSREVFCVFVLQESVAELFKCVLELDQLLLRTT